MKKLTIAAVALIGLGGCTYYTPPPYSYVPVACPPAVAGSAAAAPTTTPAAPPAPASKNSPAGTVTPVQPPPAAASTACVAVVPNYTYYSYPSYYYPYPGYYYGPPVYGSVFVGRRFR